MGEIPRHHDEVQTINRNLILNLDHNFDANWGVSVTVPLVDRRHKHVHNHHGGQMPETWDFTELGDIRVLGRYQVPGDNPATVYGVLAGVKLPTGDFNAMHSLGDMYLAGRGVPPDAAAAYRWLTLAVRSYGATQAERATRAREGVNSRSGGALARAKSASRCRNRELAAEPRGAARVR